MLGDLEIKLISIGTFWMLEDISSPLLPGKNKPIGMKDLAAAALILTDPQGACDAFRVSREEFDKLARQTAHRVPLADLASLGAILAKAATASKKV